MEPIFVDVIQKKMGLETDSYIPLIQRFRPTCIETYATDEANSS
jgi:hypothetical protein